MRFTKFFALSLIALFVINSFFPSCIASNVKDDGRPIIDSIMEKIFKLGTSVPGMGWYHLEFVPPSFYKVTPGVIDLEYLNETVFEIAEIWANGTIKKAAFEPANTPGGILQRHIFAGQTFTFEVIPPENTSVNWLAYFEPDVIEMARDVKEGDEVPYLKTKCKVYLELPNNGSYPQQDTVLQIKITRTDINGNLWIPPKGHPLYGKGLGAIMWMFGAIGWGKYSGKTEYIYNNVSILVRVNKYHKPSFIPPEPIEIGENEVTSVPVEVQNLGSHIDTFNFRVHTDSDSDLILSPPPALTLKPGDKATVSVGISTPRILNDPGSIHTVMIEMYSIDQPENIFSNSFTVTTAGVYIPFLVVYYLIIFIISIIIVMIFYKTIKNRLCHKVCKKPEKPWEIPEEKEYLEKLKEKNKEEYKKVLAMMNEEYESALLWYKSYLEAMIKKEKQEKQKVRVVTAEKPKTKKIEEKKPIETKEEKTEKPLEKPTEKIELDSLEERRKQEAILRIKHEQEKQKKKFKP